MGFIIDDILQTYRESDGVDFLATNKETNRKRLYGFEDGKGLMWEKSIEKFCSGYK